MSASQLPRSFTPSRASFLPTLWHITFPSDEFFGNDRRWRSCRVTRGRGSGFSTGWAMACGRPSGARPRWPGKRPGSSRKSRKSPLSGSPSSARRRTERRSRTLAVGKRRGPPVPVRPGNSRRRARGLEFEGAAPDHRAHWRERAPGIGRAARFHAAGDLYRHGPGWGRRGIHRACPLQRRKRLKQAQLQREPSGPTGVAMNVLYPDPPGVETGPLKIKILGSG